MVGNPEFKLQFAPQDIRNYADRNEDEDDCPAMAAAEHIAAGECTRANLEAIFKWKTKNRGVSRIRRNSDAEIADALKLAMEAKTVRAAVAVLCGLQGVNVPVASAILTVMDQRRYTIIDFRALASLGVTAPSPSLNFYVRYLDKCRELAKEFNIGLRDLDRALWQADKENSYSKRSARGNA